MRNEGFSQELRNFLESVGLQGAKLTRFLEAAGINPERMKHWRRGIYLPRTDSWKNFCLLARQSWPAGTPQNELLEMLDDAFRKQKAKTMAAQRSGRPSNTHITSSPNKEGDTSSKGPPEASKQTHAVPSLSVSARAHLSEQITAAGLTAFYPTRSFYRRYRDTTSIDQYVSTATRSVVLVSVNLMTGVPIEGLCEALVRKLNTDRNFTATVSLIDPDKPYLMKSLAPVMNMTTRELAHLIRASLNRLTDARTKLPSHARERFLIRVHNTIPMGSAILLDHYEPSGRIQIESKVYKAPPLLSFAFEVVRTGIGGFYETLATGYDHLVKDGREWTSRFPNN